MTRISVEFRVKVNEILSRDYKIFICGSCEELGSWDPERAKVMKRQEISNANKFEIWKADINVRLNEIFYRYYIASSDENYETVADRMVMIKSWESNINPRKKDIYSELFNNSLNVDEARCDIYGYIDDHYRVLHGWLTDHSAVRIRLYKNPIKFYKNRMKSKRFFVRCKYFTINRANGIDEESDDSDESGHIILNGGSNIRKISGSKGRPYELAQYSYLQEGFAWPSNVCPLEGVEMKEDSYLNFHFMVGDVEDTGFEIEVLQLSSELSRSATPVNSTSRINELDDSMTIELDGLMQISPNSTNGFVGGPNQSTTPPKHLTNGDNHMVVVGTARMAILPRDSEITTLPLYNKYNRPVGQIKIDFVAIHPLLGHRFSMQYTYQKHWKHRKMLNVGHKGSGTSYGYDTKVSGVRENTIFSLMNAYDHGADYVEFDVQLSKDKVPILYHDFEVLATLRRRGRNKDELKRVAVKDLYLQDLHCLKVDHTSVKEIIDNASFDTEETFVDVRPFPTLEECLDRVDANVGFNIELKYPQWLKDGNSEQNNYFNRNEYADEILKVVFKFVHKKRRIIFSSFDPDICLMINYKQNMYPILFLTQGPTDAFPWYLDIRTQSLNLSLYFALNSNLLGLCVYSSTLDKELDMVQKMLDHKLILFVWGDTNDTDDQNIWKERGVHGIIFDRIHEVQQKGSPNIFEADESFMQK